MIWYYSEATWEMTKSRCVTPNAILGVNKAVFKIVAEIMKNKYSPVNDYFTLFIVFVYSTFWVSSRDAKMNKTQLFSHRTKDYRNGGRNKGRPVACSRWSFNLHSCCFPPYLQCLAPDIIHSRHWINIGWMYEGIRREGASKLDLWVREDF